VRDARFTELDDAIAAGRGDIRPRRMLLKKFKERLRDAEYRAGEKERVIARMREKYGRRQKAKGVTK